MKTKLAYTIDQWINEVDEHLGDWALVDELVAAMNARGMKLVLDIALNHSNQDDDGK